MPKNLPNTFCALPWINLSTDVNGSLRPCCKFAQPSSSNEYQLPNMKDGNLGELWNDEKFQNLRRAFLDGKKPTECQSCWDEENAGVKSFRLQFAKDKNITINDLNFEPYAEKGPQALDLKLNNVCNLKCRICGAQASSTFLKEYQEMFNIEVNDGEYWLSNKILGTQNEDVVNKWAADLVHLEITGGEPMASPENIKILDLLVESGNSDKITILLNTNGTLYNTRLIKNLIKFKKVILCLSVDDLDQRFEYERYPAKWNVIQNNIKKYMSLKQQHSNLEIILCPTVSNFNVYYLPEYYKWANDLNIFIHFNILHYEPNHSIKNLPDSLKNIVYTRLNYSVFDLVKNFLMLPTEDTTLFQSFIKKTYELDKFRKQSFTNTFGVWGELVMEYQDE